MNTLAFLPSLTPADEASLELAFLASQMLASFIFFKDNSTFRAFMKLLSFDHYLDMFFIAPARLSKMRLSQTLQTECLFAERTSNAFLGSINHEDCIAKLAINNPFVFGSLRLLDHDTLIFIQTFRILYFFKNTFNLIGMQFLTTRLLWTHQLFNLMSINASFQEAMEARPTKLMSTF